MKGRVKTGSTNLCLFSSGTKLVLFFALMLFVSCADDQEIQKQNYNQNDLISVLSDGSLEEVKAFVNSEINLNQRLGTTREPLIFYIIRNPKITSIDEFINKGANPYKLNSLCIDSLTIASKMGKITIAKELLRRNVNPENRGCHHGENALANIKMNGLKKIEGPLINAIVKRRAEREPVESVFNTIKNGSEIDFEKMSDFCKLSKSGWGENLLIFSSKLGRKDLIPLLDFLPINAQDYFDNTAVNIAVKFSNINTLKDLLEYEPDLEIGDMFLRTPVYNAVVYNKEPAFFLLAEYGANLVTKDFNDVYLIDEVIKQDNLKFFKHFQKLLSFPKEDVMKKSKKFNAKKIIKFISK